MTIGIYLICGMYQKRLGQYIYNPETEAHAVKGIDRTTEKIMDGRLVNDALRFGLVVDTPGKAYEVIRAMENRGYKVWDNPYKTDAKGNLLPAAPDLEDLYKDPTPGYKHVAVKFVFGPDDPVVKELQMLTPEMVRAKASIGHDLYDVIRAFEGAERKGIALPEEINNLRDEYKTISNILYSAALERDLASSTSAPPLTSDANWENVKGFSAAVSRLLSSSNDILNAFLAPKSANSITFSSDNPVAVALKSFIDKHLNSSIAEPGVKSNSITDHVATLEKELKVEPVKVEQPAEPQQNQPIGTFDSLQQFPPVEEAAHEFWMTRVNPMLSEMSDKAAAWSPGSRIDSAALPKETLNELKQYIAKQENNLADTKASAMRS